MPRIDLANRPIAITGASSGIGRATALACARAGMPVAVGARRLDRLEALVADIERAGGRAIAVECDVTSIDECERLVARTAETYGSLHALFANAGYAHECPALDMNDADIRALLETNFHGTLNAVRPAAARMRAAGAGHILVCSSCLSKIPIPHYAAYTISKAAQDHLAGALRLELARERIHVSSVHPVGTRTELFEKAAQRSGRTRLMDWSPERRMQPPERVADAVVACLRRPRPEVWTSHPMRLAIALSTLTPRLTDRALRTLLRRRLNRTDKGA